MLLPHTENSSFLFSTFQVLSVLFFFLQILSPHFLCARAFHVVQIFMWYSFSCTGFHVAQVFMWACRIKQVTLHIITSDWCQFPVVCWHHVHEDPNTEKVQKNAVYYGKAQHARFRSNRLYQATKQFF